ALDVDRAPRAGRIANLRRTASTPGYPKHAPALELSPVRELKVVCNNIQSSTLARALSFRVNLGVNDLGAKGTKSGYGSWSEGLDATIVRGRASEKLFPTVKCLCV